jgi:FecR-like protein
MRKYFYSMQLAMFAVVLSVFAAGGCYAQTRDKFVISARAGGINAVSGQATVQARDGSDWQQLTIKNDLDAGDVVRTGADGRVEILLNPGSYLRLAENSQFELADNSLQNLEIRLLKGTAIVEATGADETELLINITTPHTKLAIVRGGLYRLNVIPDETTELFVRKGRVLLGDSHTKIKGGDKVTFSGTAFSVAKLDKKEKDSFDQWSKERAESLVQVNRRISGRMVNAFLANFSDDWFHRNLLGRSGFWLFNPRSGCFTFVPFYLGWGSPYGTTYSSVFYSGNYYCCGRRQIHGGQMGTIVGRPAGRGSSTGIGGTSGVDPTRPSRPARDPDFPGRGRGKPDLRPDR